MISLKIRKLKDMKILSIISLLLSVMVSLLIPSLANADPEKLWIFQPRLTTGIMHYEFDFKFTAPGGAVPSTVKLFDDMPFFGGGAMLLYDRCFADAYFQLSTTGKDDEGTEQDTEYVRRVDNEFDRKDYAITFGCMVTNNLSFFTGYKNGKTDIHIASTQNWPYDRIDEESTGDVEFKSDGLFLGVAYTHPIGNGQLGVQLAATKLDAEYNQHNFTRTNDRAVGDKPDTNDENWFLLGNTLGWTLGTNWTAPISKHLWYGISFNYSNYDFDLDSAYVIRKGEPDPDFINTLGSGMNYDMIETVYSLQLQLSYQFK